jgi:hypothetical protein
MPLSQIVSASIEDGAVAPVDLSSVAQYYGYKNRLINGGMAVDQRNNGASQTLPAAYTYTVDRWFAYSGGANTTGQRVASGVTGVPYVYQITGTAGVTFLQYMQRIEAINIADLAGSAVTLSALISNSTLTTINWYIYIAGSTDNYTAATLYTSGGWTVNSTLTSYNAQFTLPTNAANGVWVVFQAGAQTSGTWRIGNAQLEKGVTATSFDYRPYGTELSLCQRYYEIVDVLFFTLGWASAAVQAFWKVTKRTTPTLTNVVSSGTGGSYQTFASGSPFGSQCNQIFQVGANSASAGGYVIGNSEL